MSKFRALVYVERDSDPIGYWDDVIFDYPEDVNESSFKEAFLSFVADDDFIKLQKESRITVGYHESIKRETFYLNTDKILYFKIVEV